MAATKMLQKLLSSMDLPEDAVGKLVELQKSMFDSGASLNDIANLMQMVLDQVWSLTQFYSVDFSQLRTGVEKCVFNKHTLKVCIRCS